MENQILLKRSIRDNILQEPELLLKEKFEFPEPKIISFRDEVSEIGSSQYLTHSLYYHPAKFIPQIVKYCLDKYCKEGGIVLDPFAGSGTTALESSIKGHDSFMTDINPLLGYFYPIKMPEFSLNDWLKIQDISNKFLKKIFSMKKEKVIKINGDLEYWYPKILYEYFNNLWNNYHSLKGFENDLVRKNVILVLFRLSKYYSYAEHSMPKLFISKKKRQFIDNLLQKETIFGEIEARAFDFLEDINKSVLSLLSREKLKGKIKYYSGVDSYSFNYAKLPKIDCIITSPPYLQAQEYMRTFKMEMRWSGIPNEKIKEYTAKEIPFRKTEGIIDGKYINSVKKGLVKKYLIDMFDSYFWFTIKTLEHAASNLNKGGKICILIGNPKMEGIEVEIWKVIYEYFVKNLKYKPLEVFEDRIVYRKLFKGRNNQNPNGMKSEYLIVLEKI